AFARSNWTFWPSNSTTATGHLLAKTATSPLRQSLQHSPYSEIVETPQISFGWSEYPWIGKEGTQYEAFRDKDINNNGDNDCLTLPARGEWWERSLHPQYSVFFGSVGNDGFPGNSNFAAGSSFVCPAWCF
ncbi:hypothetical protein AAAX36_04045, partial [Collinsella sp. CLA-ER-H10]|uniref:hypothetical protein n=1 Tax=Collinsella sp. CLA-ER-H10 TaxID=3136218 RepID=UPI0032BF9E1F